MSSLLVLWHYSNPSGFLWLLKSNFIAIHKYSRIFPHCLSFAHLYYPFFLVATQITPYLLHRARRFTSLILMFYIIKKIKTESKWQRSLKEMKTSDNWKSTPREKKSPRAKMWVRKSKLIIRLYWFLWFWFPFPFSCFNLIS